MCFVVLTFQAGSLFPIWPKRVCAAENMFFRNRVNIFRVKKEIACLKQGSELTDFCLKHAQGLKASATHPHPNLH